MIEKLKIKVPSFVASIFESDALYFGFTKNGAANRNALLNKLIPTLVMLRKARRSEIEFILKCEYNRKDSENIYEAVNTVIDRVYFNSSDYDLDEYIWIRPSKETLSVYDEIETSETTITAQTTPSYIRSLLYEYVHLPLYKREMFVFDNELDIFDSACQSQQILHFRDKNSGHRYKAFAYDYCYGYIYDETNYCIFYDLDCKKIQSIALHRIQDIYMIKQKYRPDEQLLQKLRDYYENYKFTDLLHEEEL